MSEDMLGISLRDLSGPMSTFLDRLSGRRGPRWLSEFNKFLRKEPTWQVDKSLEVIHAGESGKKLLQSLKENQFEVCDEAEYIVGQRIYVKKALITYKLVILRGDELRVRKIGTVGEEALARGYQVPPVVVAPLLRMRLDDEDMGLMGLKYLIVMHNPIASPGILRRLGLSRAGNGDQLVAYNIDSFPDPSVLPSIGFVYLASQV